MIDSQEEWKRKTAIRKVEQDQRAENPPPIAHSFKAAAGYVGADAAAVERWYRGRAR